MRAWNIQVFLTIGLLAGLISVSLSATGLSEEVLSYTLHQDLFENYSSNLIPICSQGGNVTLTVDIALRQIMELNEREQILTSNVWLRLNWQDCRLKWDPINYNNLTSLMVKYDDVWVPDITLYDSAAEEVMFPGREDYRVYISSSGSVSYNFPTVTKSICRVKVKYFPFDTQECPLQFGSWSHHGLELDIVSKNPTGDLDSYIENTEWSVSKIPIKRHVFYYNCCPEPYPDVTFYIVMDRRPHFYLLTFLFPCILTSSVAALAFLLPVESGEKVSLEITVLLSLAVFLLLVSEALPPSSDDFPIIGSYFASSMVLVSLSLFQTVIVVNVFYRGTNGRRVPRWVKLVFLQYIGRVLCIQSNQVHCVNDGKRSKITKVAFEKDCELRSFNPSNEDDDKDVKGLQNGHIPNGPKLSPIVSPQHTPFTQDMKSQTIILHNIQRHLQDQEEESSINSEWRDVSNVLDRLFLALYLFILVVSTLGFLMQCV